MILGIAIIVVASLLRAWGLRNHRRGPMCAIIFRNPLFSFGVAAGSIILAVTGGVMISHDAGPAAGVIAFVLFWLCSGIWLPILSGLGL